MRKKVVVVIIFVLLIAIGVAIFTLNRENAKTEVEEKVNVGSEIEETNEMKENIETVNETEKAETSNGATEEKQEEQENKEAQRNIIKKNGKITHDSIILIEQIRVIDKQRLQEYLCKIEPEKIDEINKAMIEAFDITNKYK